MFEIIPIYIMVSIGTLLIAAAGTYTVRSLNMAVDQQCGLVLLYMTISLIAGAFINEKVGGCL